MVRKTLASLVFAAQSGAIILVACSDEVGPKYPNADSFCDAKADAECKEAAGVCGVSIDLCKNRRVDICRRMASAAVSQGRTYKPDLAENCLNETTQLYATKAVNLEAEAKTTETCERVFAGVRKKGENCGQTFECEGALVCDRTFCADRVQRVEGEPCNNPGEVCATGSYCGPRGPSNFCNPKNKLGDICKDTPCREELRCNGSTCVEKVAVGGSCDRNEDCTTTFCDAQKKCATKLVPGSGSCNEFGG